MSKYFTCKEVASYFRVGVTTVRDWIQKGKLVAIRVGKNFRISESAINEFEKLGG